VTDSAGWLSTKYWRPQRQPGLFSPSNSTASFADDVLRSIRVAVESAARSADILYAMQASERFTRLGIASATSRIVLFIPLSAFAVLLLSPANSSARRTSQELPPGSVPLVPSILKAGVTIPDPCPHTTSMEPKRYMVAWNDTPAIDGDFMLVVHPTQLFLRTGHNNPNPNYVYWVEQLSEGQYTRLVRFFDKYSARLFRRERSVSWPGYTVFTLTNPRISPHRPERMTNDTEAAWQSTSDAAVNSNLRRILRELNRGLSQDETLRLDAAISSYPNIVRIAQ
jgi:hypothetical protein